MQIDGNGQCDQKTKGAYPVIFFVLKHFILVLEIDENEHKFYDATCELVRYDTMQYGQEKLRKTVCIRFNPHQCTSVVDQPAFLERVKELVQIIRTILKNEAVKTPSSDELVMNIMYLGYNQVCHHI